MLPKYSYWLLALAAILLSRFVGMAIFPFADTTEPRYAEIARLMVETGDWITPWFEPGVPFWGKPPLSFWSQAAAIKLFGLSEFALRLPSWLATIGMVYLTWRLALQLWGSHVARWSALIFSSMALTYVSAGAVMTDAFLALGTTLSLVSFCLATQEQGFAWRWLFFLGLAIGLLAKGPLAAVLVGIPIVLWLLFRGGKLSDLKALPWLRGGLITAVLVLPWYVLAELQTPGFLDYFLVGEHFRRFVVPGWAGDLYGRAHQYPRGTIWVFWLMASFPWGILALFMLIAATVRRRLAAKRSLNDRMTLLLLLYALGPLLLFTLAGNILWTYALPSLPFAAILIARPVSALSAQSWPGRLRAPAAAITPLLLTSVVITVGNSLTLVKSEKSLANYYSRQSRPADSPLLYLDKLPFSARFYSQGRARAVTAEQFENMRERREYRRYFAVIPARWPNERITALFGDASTGFTDRRHRLLSIQERAVDLVPSAKGR